MILHVQVKAGKRKEKAEYKNGQWIISINAPAAEGKANTRLVEFLSEILNIPKSSIEIMRGFTSPYKALEIRLSEDLVSAALKKSLQ
jgi:uncharacterized protein (TIGR00251 family)